MIDVVFRVVCIIIISANIQHIETNNIDRLSVLVKLGSSSRLRTPVGPTLLSLAQQQGARSARIGVFGFLKSQASFRLLAYPLS